MESLEGDDLNYHSYSCIIVSCSCIYDASFVNADAIIELNIWLFYKSLTRFGTKLSDNLGIDDFIFKVISHIGRSDYCVYNANTC